MTERQIRVIKAKPKKLKPFLNVGVYCRVSTPSQEQLHSLAAQVSHFVRKYHDLYNYRLYDVYIDVVSGAKTLARPGYQRMLEDCRRGFIDVIVTKSISRFGRDTGEALKCVRELMSMNVAIIFEEEGIEAERGNELILTIISAIAQAENEERSQNTCWGIKTGAANGTSKLYRRKCYGYTENAQGILEIIPDQSETVVLIFYLFLQGYSLDMIRDTLHEKGILSPAGRDYWSKKTISAVLENEKYCGHVILLKTMRAVSPDFKRVKNRGERERYQILNHHPAIISDEVFDRVQKEKARRSNIEETETGYRRKETHYSAKRDMGGKSTPKEVGI